MTLAAIIFLVSIAVYGLIGTVVALIVWLSPSADSFRSYPRIDKLGIFAAMMVTWPKVLF